MVEQKKVLVPGATGLVGRALTRELVRRGFHVTSVSSRPVENLHPEVQKLFKELDVKQVAMDLAGEAELEGAPNLTKLVESGNFDIIICLVADRGGTKWHGVKGAMNHPTLNSGLPVVFAKLGERFTLPVVHMSTEYVWSGSDNEKDGYPALRVGQDTRILEQGVGAPYAQQKRDAEEALLPYGGTIIVRVPVLYGPMLSPLEDGTCGSCINDCLKDNKFKHDTWQMRYPTNAEDVAFFLGSLATKRVMGGLKHGVYHYGSQESISKHEFMLRFLRTAMLPVSRIQAESKLDVPQEKRPPYNVKLDIRASRDEFEAAGDWREPRAVDTATIQRIWMPHFKGEVKALKPSKVKPGMIIAFVAAAAVLVCAWVVV